jgi:hypothetical protein
MLRRSGLLQTKRKSSCDESEIHLHSVVDSEIDAVHACRVETHVDSCVRGAAELVPVAPRSSACIAPSVVSCANLRFLSKG